ncbi:MAG: CocE/NonD family hydrolase [Gemmatimonadales bacterium]
MTSLLLVGLLQAAAPPIVMSYDVRVPMRDGVTLSADVYRPAGSAKVPTILVRTPYDNGTAPNVASGKLWAGRGYALVLQDVRGRGESDGTFYPLATEADDGYDTIEWIARQPWSDGKVGMMGGSYLGWVQMYAAIAKPPALKALIPIVTPPDPDRNFPVQHGAYGPATISWLAAVSGKTMQDISQHDLRATYSHLPLYEADQLLGRTLAAWRDWLDHPVRDEYWEKLAFQKALAQVDVPMLHVSGWYDDVLVGTTENYDLMKEKPNQFMLIGPWGHQVNRSRKLGQIDFGPEAVINLDSLYLRWFDRWLKDVDNGVERDPKVRIFVMEENRWREEREWPLARARMVKFYLKSGGSANSRLGDGRLDPAAGSRSAGGSLPRRPDGRLSVPDRRRLLPDRRTRRLPRGGAAAGRAGLLHRAPRPTDGDLRPALGAALRRLLGARHRLGHQGARRPARRLRAQAQRRRGARPLPEGLRSGGAARAGRGGGVSGRQLVHLHPTRRGLAAQARGGLARLPEVRSQPPDWRPDRQGVARGGGGPDRLSRRCARVVSAGAGRREARPPLRAGAQPS